MTTRKTLNLSAYTTIMIRAAQQMECSLEVVKGREHLVKGRCPFHESKTDKAGFTLLMDTNRGFFTCYNCKTQGTAQSFIARVWDVCLADVPVLAAGENQPGMNRPPYPAQYLEPIQKGNKRTHPQMSALLTLANRFYHANLQAQYEGIRFLINAGVELGQTARLGVGFSTGNGLREYLLANDVTEAELNGSALFIPESGGETLKGRVTLAEMDDSDGVTWLTSFNPPENKPWTRRRPGIVPLMGRRPILLNNRVLRRRQRSATLTDDPRVYVMLNARDIPACLITRKSPSPREIDQYTARVVETLTRRGARRIHLMLQDTTVASRLNQKLQEAEPPIKATTIRRAEMDSLLRDRMPDLHYLQEAVNRESQSVNSKSDDYQTRQSDRGTQAAARN